VTLRFDHASLPDSVRLPSAPIPEIPPPEALVHAVRATRRVWEMGGRRARVRLGGIQGVELLEGDGATLLEAVEVVGGVGANVLLGPRTTRREVIIPGGSVQETVLIPDALPGALLQWSPAGPKCPRAVPLRMRLPGASIGGAAHRGPGTLWVALDGTGLLLHLPGCEARAELVEEAGHWAIRWDLPMGAQPTTLLVMAAPEGARWASPKALSGAAAHHRRGEIVALGGGEPGAELETGVEELDQGLLWSRAWLRDHLLTPPGAAPRIHPPGALTLVGGGIGSDDVEGVGAAADAPAWLARAATVSGDWEAARGALAALSWQTPWQRLHSALALARYAAWTADGRPLKAAAEVVRSAFSEPEGLRDIPEAVAVSVWETVQAAAEAVEVASLSGLPRPTPPPRNLSRELPVLGSGAPPAEVPTPASEHPWLPRLGFGPAPAAVVRARRALGEVAADPTILGEGAGIAAVLELVEGMMGAVPDATFSRLALSPLLPPTWTAFRLRGIRTGEGILQLDYERDEDRALWTLVPREGSVPLTAIFKPWLPWSRIVSVRIDEQEAALDVEEVGGWSRLQVQIPVDGEHTVEVVGEGPRADALPGIPSTLDPTPLS